MKSAPHDFQGDLRESAPEPGRGLGRWRAELAGFVRRDPDARWGAQLLRIASDMIVICDDQLTIRHHNRAFLKAVGHNSGSFKGKNLGDFFPATERDGVYEAFDDWRRGHAAGMRFQAPLLTMRGTPRSCDFRVVRSRDSGGCFFYYLVAREAAESRRSGRGGAEEDCDPFFRGLPVAAWRTDAELRITQAYGSLWPEMGAASEDLIGEVFGRRHDTLLPDVLLGIDCSDTLAGMSLQTEVEREGECFNVTVEPFLDAAGQVVGTVGLLRRTAISRGETAGNGHGSRHHAPPTSQPGGISIVTGRVAKFNPESDRPTEPVVPVLPRSMTRIDTGHR